MSTRRRELCGGCGARALLISAMLVSVPAQASPPTKAECIASNATAQDERRAGHFAASRRELHICVSKSCPALLRDDCGKQMMDLDAAQPTLVLEVKDDTGADVSGATVLVDTSTTPVPLSGAPLPVDPGSHVFTVAGGGFPSVSKTLVVSEGDRLRRERFVLVAAAAPIEPPRQATPSAPSSITWRAAAIGVGGVGVVSAVIGSVFGGLAISEKNGETNACPQNLPCLPSASRTTALSDRSTAETDATVSTVMFVAAGALVATGVALFFAAPKSSEGSPRTSFAPTIGTQGGGFVVRGSF